MRRTPAAAAARARLVAARRSRSSKSTARADGVDQVVDDVDPVHGPVQVRPVQGVALHDLVRAGPVDVAELVRAAGEAAHLVARVQQHRGEPATDVAGGAGHEDAHLSQGTAPTGNLGVGSSRG